MYMAVFTFLHPGRCTHVYMLDARLYYDTCAPLHRPVCTYTFATRMKMLHTLRHGGSRLSGTSLHAKLLLVDPSCKRVNHFFARNMDALPCVRRCSWWVPTVRGETFFREIRWPVRWAPTVRWRNNYFTRNKVAPPCCGRGPSCQPLHV